jgi:hypothetical protein
MEGWKRAARAAALVALPLTLLLAACATRYGTQGIGQYDLYSPYADLTRGAREVELTRGGHIAILDIFPLNPAYTMPRDHRTFRALFPATERDSTYYAAGTHRVRHALTVAPNRPRCEDGVVPSMTGCRQDLSLSQRTSGQIATTNHYLLLVAEEPIDPYTVAFHLNEAILTNELLMPALFERDASAAAQEIAKVIADLPGLSAWSGYYVVRQN